MKRIDGGWGRALRRAANVAAASGAALLLSVPVVQAKGAFLTEIPAAPDSCKTCHIQTFPASWNDFGLDVRDNLEAGKPAWAAVCPLDSDGDGATNGEELGDPDCLWTPGDGTSPEPHFLPGDDSSTPPTVTPDPGPVEPMPEAVPDAQPSEPTPEMSPELGPEPMPEMTPDMGTTDTTASPDAGAELTTTTPAADDGCSSTGSNGSVPMSAAVLAVFGWGLLNRRRRQPSQRSNKGPALRG